MPTADESVALVNPTTPKEEGEAEPAGRAQFEEELVAFNEKYGVGRPSRAPIIAGKKLDLYKLFLAVSFNEGFDQVDAQRGWKELGAQIDVSSTPGGGALRANYLKYLWAFEQRKLRDLEVTPDERARALGAAAASEGGKEGASVAAGGEEPVSPGASSTQPTPSVGQV